MIPQPGSTIRLGPGCGVPFEWAPLIMRFIRAEQPPAFATNGWIEGYELDDLGNAVELRTVYPILAGIQTLRPPAPAALPGRQRLIRNTGPHGIPRPRPATQTTTGGIR